MHNPLSVVSLDPALDIDPQLERAAEVPSVPSNGVTRGKRLSTLRALARIRRQLRRALRDIRSALQLTRGAVARDCGIDTAKYAQYERGKRAPSLAELIGLCEALKTTPNVLLGYELPAVPSAGDNQ